MPNMLELVNIGYQLSDNKWPDTSDMNYDDVLLRRHDSTYNTKYGPVNVRNRRYPVHRAFALVGERVPVEHSRIDNRVPPAKSVMDTMIHDLKAIANDGVSVCLWEHTWHCYPYVASHLKEIFKHSIFIHADDSPGVVEARTAPVARYFDSGIHCNVIWNSRGDTTEGLYHNLGVKDTHYATMSTSGGLDPVTDLDSQIKKIRNREYSTDLSFVGTIYPGPRHLLNTSSASQLFANAGMRTRIHGAGMRDGALKPIDPCAPARPVGALYRDSFAVLNSQYIGLMACRPYDVWASGSLLVQWDPVKELDYLGIKAGVHYASFDGTIHGLIKTVQYYQEHLDEAEAVIRAGHEIGKKLSKEHSTNNAMGMIFERHWHKWGF